ncbi:MAG: Asp-tRNA(Asn)/Glu-tRNA(Gln) amidotransferase subunit GatC [Dehalococcoidia bacterium]|nr:Asp-tRNA(Asn)/Glu-tRNA(Gln) amidotransferase subunit GatC [Dehalococcoidia bacterium]
MSLTRDQVLHIAKLARMGVEEAEIEKFQRQLSQILDHFARLSEVDTENVPPTAYAVPLQNVARDDEPRQSYDRDKVLANAPMAEDGYFRVRAVLE